MPQTKPSTSGPQRRVLVAEDHAPLRAQVVGLLQADGWLADEASDGRLALQLALEHPPDLLVLDLGLPGMDGLRVCQALREQLHRPLPVLMLTARDTLDDKGAGFAAGADDYLLKPFAGDELRWRCRALLRRAEGGAAAVLTLGPLRLDRAAAQVHCDGRPLDLPPQPYRLLLALAEAWPRTVARSELQRRLWADEPPQSDALRSHLYALRRALGPQQALVRTVQGVGLRIELPAP